jgi:hypothetical protein
MINIAVSVYRTLRRLPVPTLVISGLPAIRISPNETFYFSEADIATATRV